MRRIGIGLTLVCACFVAAEKMSAQQAVNKETTKVILQIDVPSAVPGTTAVSPDGHRAAYVVQRGKKLVTVVDGSEGKPYESILMPGPIFSPDGKQVAYGAKLGKKWVAVVDGTEGNPYEAVGVLQFGPDGRQVAYIAELNKRKLVVLNGVNGKPYDGITGVVFSPDGRRLAYGARVGTQWMVVVDGAEGKPCDSIVEPGIVFSGDSRHVAYIARTDKMRFVLDGVEGKPYDAIGKEGAFFSPDSQRTVYAAKNGDKWMIVVDGVEGKPYDLIGQDGPVFSPDSRRLAYVAGIGTKRVVVIDGTETQPYDGAAGPVFSPDSQRFAYIAEIGKKSQVIIDGSAGKSYDAIAGKGLTFSPDNKRVAYIAQTGEKWAVVLDGIEDKSYAGISGPKLFFSPDSRHLGYIADLGVKKAFVVDGAEGKHYDSFFAQEIGFDSPDAYHYVVSKQHDASQEVLRVEGAIPACLETSCSGTQSAAGVPPDAGSKDSLTEAAAPVQPSATPTKAPARTANVILIPPQVRLEDMVTGRVLNPKQFHSATQHSSYESRLLGAATKKISPKTSVLAAEEMGEVVAEAGSNLQGLSSRLAHGNVIDEAKQEFSHLAALNEQQLVFVQFIRVKIGPGGYWDPNTGAIGSATRSTLVQAALISCRSGQVIWKGEQFVRKALDPDSEELGKMLTQLLESLEIP